jgi:hypothetical protein
MIRIRPSRPEEGPVIRTIERGRLGKDSARLKWSLADDEPSSAGDLAAYAISGRNWVAADESEKPPHKRG